MSTTLYYLIVLSKEKNQGRLCAAPVIKREKFSALRVLSLKYPLLCLGQSVNRHWSSSPRRIRASIISEWPNLQTRNQAGFSGIGFGQIAFNQMICAIHVSCRDVKWTGTLAQSKREIEIFQTLRHRYYTYGIRSEEKVCAGNNIFITKISMFLCCPIVPYLRLSNPPEWVRNV